MLWEIPADARPDMRVPARVFADERVASVEVGGVRLPESFVQLLREPVLARRPGEERSSPERMV